MIVLSDKWLAALSDGWLAALSDGRLASLSDGWFALFDGRLAALLSATISSGWSSTTIPELAKGELRFEADMPLTTPLWVVLPAGTI